MRWQATVFVFVVAVSAALAPNAFAATASVESGDLTYRAAPGEANDIQAAQSAGTVTISDQGAVIIGGAGCTQLGDHQVSCAPVDQAFFLLGDLDDRAEITQGGGTDIGPIGVFGQDGADILRNCAQCFAPLSGGRGGDTLEGGDVGTFLSGGSGTDTITGGAGRDSIAAGEGADSIASGGEADEIWPGNGDDHVDAGEGRDEIDLSDSPTPVVVDLLAGTVTGYGMKTLVGVEDVVGTGRRDELYGDHGANLFWGEEGADLLVGRGGGDILISGPGRTDDRLYGGPGPDRLLDFGGADLLVGGWGDDRLGGGSGPDLLVGGRGDDLLSGGGGADRLYGRSGNDTLRARDLVRDVVAGGTGADRARIDTGLDVSRSIEAFF